MAVVRIPRSVPYVNVDQLPLTSELYLIGLTARQLHIARTWCFPWARRPDCLVRPLGTDFYEVASDAEVSAYIDDVDILEDNLGGVPQMLLWADTGDLEPVGTVESAGDSDSVPRGDHVHSLPIDIAAVTKLVDPEGSEEMTIQADGSLRFAATQYIYLMAHLTGSIASGGTVVSLMTATLASGLLMVGSSTTYVSGIFACCRTNCVALGTLASNLTNVKDTASKVNVYYDSDGVIKAQNNYSTAVQLRLLWLAAYSSAKLNQAI